MKLDGTGIWSGELRYGDATQVPEAAAELEELGYSALWVPDVGGNLFAVLRTLLDATRRTVIATGILNLWMHEPDDAAAQFADLTSGRPGRLLVGIGISHRPLVDATVEAGTYARPLATMAAYLDGLDAADPPLPSSSRVLAALGPKMLALARDRSAGAHPYLVTPDHTRIARTLLGPDRLLAPEQAVALTTDPERGRSLARQHLATYLNLPNYTNSWRRIGFTQDDLRDGGSDRLVDEVVAWGDESAIADRVRAHRDAGADHVCVQVLTEDAMAFPRDDWRRLAPALI